MRTPPETADFLFVRGESVFEVWMGPDVPNEDRLVFTAWCN